MKRRELIRHLEAHGCEFLREGRDHTVYVIALPRKHLRFPDIARSTTSSREKYVGTYRFLSPELPVGVRDETFPLEERKEPSRIDSEA